MITTFKHPFLTVFDEVLDSSVFTKNPQISVRKNESEYKILMSVPGLTKEDIKITTKDGNIIISYKKEEKSENHLFVNNFQKTYSLPDDVNENEIKGKVEHGILELTLPFSRKKPTERLISLI